LASSGAGAVDVAGGFHCGAFIRPAYACPW
jgi:hypothetical protein